MNSKIDVKKSGFSYVEFIFSFMLLMNLFVLLNQIFYNINTQNNLLNKERILSYETVMLRIENHFKEVTMVEVGSDYLIYQYRNQDYQYTLYQDQLILTFDGTQIILLDDIKSISFELNGYFLQVKITNLYSELYETQVIYHVEQ